MALSDSLDAHGAANTAPSKEWEAGAHIEGDVGTVTTGPVNGPITDWDQILLIWNLDPAAFQIDGVPTFKAWDGFAKETDADGTSHIVSKRLFSYKVNVVRTTPEMRHVQKTIDRWLKKLNRTQIYRAPSGTGDPVTYVALVADPQIGKKGTAQALDNWRRGVLGHARRIAWLLEHGVNVTRVAVAYMGDEHEGVANNYPNQPFTVELNFSKQIETDFEMRVWTIVTFIEITGLPVDVFSVISNHGEWTRNGSKDVVTTKGDNSSTSVARLVKQMFDKLPQYDVTWSIAGSNPDIVTDLAGVRVSFSHGHVAKGRGTSTEQRVKNAIERQILARRSLVEVDIYFVAHYHHYYMQDFEGRTLVGCPALEAEKSSEWMLDQFGVWSPPGMLGIIVGSSLGVRGWAEPVIF